MWDMYKLLSKGSAAYEWGSQCLRFPLRWAGGTWGMYRMRALCTDVSRYGHPDLDFRLIPWIWSLAKALTGDNQGILWIMLRVFYESLRWRFICHCEERSDEAISDWLDISCFGITWKEIATALCAMTSGEIATSAFGRLAMTIGLNIFKVSWWLYICCHFMLECPHI